MSSLRKARFAILLLIACPAQAGVNDYYANVPAETIEEKCALAFFKLRDRGKPLDGCTYDRERIEVSWREDSPFDLAGTALLGWGTGHSSTQEVRVPVTCGGVDFALRCDVEIMASSTQVTNRDASRYQRFAPSIFATARKGLRHVPALERGALS